MLGRVIDKRYCFLFLVLAVILWMPQSALAANIQLDGQFGDWDGQAVFHDPSNDANASGDILNFYWATNDGEERLYFMVERRGRGENPDPFPTAYRVYFDLNDNGKYTNGTDCYIDVVYHPFLNGLITVNVCKGNDGKWLNAYSGNWGEWSKNGGRRCEFYVSMDDLKLLPGQPVRMYARSFSFVNDRVPDDGDIQWSPIPIIGWIGLIVAFVLILTVICIIIVRRRKLV